METDIQGDRLVLKKYGRESRQKSLAHEINNVARRQF
jgi:hypothetical protein